MHTHTRLFPRVLYACRVNDLDYFLYIIAMYVWDVVRAGQRITTVAHAHRLRRMSVAPCASGECRRHSCSDRTPRCIAGHVVHAIAAALATLSNVAACLRCVPPSFSPQVLRMLRRITQGGRDEAVDDEAAEMICGP